MVTAYSPILKLALPVQGELSGTWGDVVNDNITSMVEQAIAGRAVIDTWTTNSHVLTTANGTTSESRCAMLEFTDTGTALSGAGTVTCPTLSKIYIAKNASGQNVTLKTSGGTGILVPNGRTMFLFCDGTNVVEAVTSTTSLQLGISTIVTAVLDEDDMASDSATSLATQQSIKAYVDSQVGTVDTLAEILAIGNTTGATDIAVDSAQKVQFRDAAIYINSSVDGQLDIVADTEIQIAATTVDLNGALDVSGTALVTGVLTTTAATVSNGGGQFNGAINVGIDDTGYDVKFFGATTGKYLLWDESADSLIVTGTTTLVGTTNLDAVDIDGATQIDATVTVGVDDTGYDVKFFGATAGKSLLWDESADSLIITGSTSLQGGLEVGLDDTGYDVKFFGATAGAYMLWDESADDLILGGAAGLSVNSTALVTGVLTTTAATVHTGGITMPANAKAIFGDSSDLQIYHTGTYSLIADTSGTGPLRVVTNTFQLNNAADTQNMIAAAEGGAVTLYNAGNAKLATTATGVDVTGTVTATGTSVFASLDISGDIDVDGTTNLDVVDIDGATQIDATVTVGIDDTGYDVKFFGATAGAYMLWDESADTLEVSGTVVADGLTVDGTSGYVRLQDLNAAVVSGTDMGGIEWRTGDSTVVGANRITARVRVEGSGTFNGADVAPSRMIFSTHAASGVNPVDRMKIDYDGDISFYEDTGTTAKLTWSAGTESLRFDSATLQAINGTDPFLSGNAYYDGSNWKYATSTDATNYYQTGQQHIWRNAASGTAGNNITWSESMRIDSSGNVGIGIAPQSFSDLMVNTATDRNIGIFDNALGATIGGITDAGASAALRLAGSPLIMTGGGGSGATHMTVDSEGNVGIGVVPEAWSALFGTRALQVGAQASLSNINGDLHLSSNAYYDATDARWEYINADYATKYTQVDGIHQWLTAASGSADAAITWSESMRIDSSGTVGIGTSSPDTTTKLTVAGAITVTGANSGHGASRLKLGQDTSAISQIRFYGADNSTAGILQFTGSSADGAVGAERMRIDSTGNVGIGTSTPSSFYSAANNLVIGTGSGAHGLTIYSGSGDSGYIGFNDTVTNGMQGFIDNHSTTIVATTWHLRQMVAKRFASTYLQECHPLLYYLWN
jgi:hypothetical protein